MSDKIHRSVVAAFKGVPTSDGAGVKLPRVIGQPSLPDLDPFLLFDAFGSDDPGAYIAGFPDHPHRGFETVTYMLEGRMAGFQLWVNLPAKDKMTAPRYQDIAPDKVPVVDLGNGVTAKLLAGTLNNVTGPVDPGATRPFYTDLTFAAGGRAVIRLTPGHNGFAYVFEGAASVGGTPLPRGSIGVLSDGDDVVIEAAGGARVLVVAGQPLREPVARYGPFVMNTKAEIQQAFADFQAGLFS